MAVSDESKQKDDAVDPVTVEDEVAVDAQENDVEPEKVTLEPTDQAVPKSSRGGFFALVFGGVVAAAIGFIVAQYTGNTGWPFGPKSSAVDDLTAVVDAQAQDVSSLVAEIAELRTQLDGMAPQSDLAKIEDRQNTSQIATDALASGLDQLKQRLTDIENRPIPEVGATVEAVAAYERELVAMRQMFETELSRIETAQKEASEAGEVTTARANITFERASLARVEAALDSGAPFTDALGALSDAEFAVPESLMAAAKTGVPTLAQLQSDFPDAARAALSASATVDPEAGQFSRFSAFLKAQLGARSLEPREGDNPDAVLSRVEEALRKGNITQSVAELEALPETALDQMSDWITQAQMRQDSLTAVAALAAELNE